MGTRGSLCGWTEHRGGSAQVAGTPHCPSGLAMGAARTSPSANTLLASLTLSLLGHAGSAGCASEERLFHKLFSHYNQFIRPVENVSEPVTVHFEVAITQLANVVSAASSPRVPGEPLTRVGVRAEQFLNTVPVIACGKYRNFKI